MTGAPSYSDHYQSKIYIKLKGARSITKQSQLSACMLWDQTPVDLSVCGRFISS